MDITSAFETLTPSLSAIASTQSGAFTAAQARSAGYQPEEIFRLRGGRPRREQWWSIRRGVYVIKEWYDALSPTAQHEVRVAALQLVLKEPAVFSHESAAVELGLAMLDPDLSLLHVSRSGLSGPRVEAGVRHHASDLPEDQVLRRPGRASVTELARTAVDVARETPRLECAVAVCDSALRHGATPEELSSMHLACRNWRGARMASRAIRLADGRAANPGESWSRVVLESHGQAPTDLQHAFFDERGLIGYVDFFWEAERTVGEFDGKVKYVIPAGASPDEAARVLWLEKIREDRLRALGLEVVRWCVADLYHPSRLAARIAAARARGAARGLLGS